MPITEQEIISYVDELGLSDAARTAVLNDLKANEKAATQFVGQRTRHADYTRKTEELAREKQALSGEKQKYGQAISAYETQLKEADTKVAKIMKDFEKESISRATAEARLQTVKQTYALSDEDIPEVTTPAAAARAADTSIDFDAKLKAFGEGFGKTVEESIMRRIAPELLALPAIASIQYDLMSQHKDLTGKPLTRQDMMELMAESTKSGSSLESAWERKYNIPGIRVNREVETQVTRRLKEEEDKRIAANSAAALESVRGANPNDPSLRSNSPVLARSFAPKDEHGKPIIDTQRAPDQLGSRKMSPAEKAAATYIDRRANGIKLGAPPVEKVA